MRRFGSFGRFCFVLMVALIATFGSGCATKNKSQKTLTQTNSTQKNLTKVILNISSHTDGYKKQKSVLSYWCKLESNLESSAHLADNIDLQESSTTIDSPKSPAQSQTTKSSTKISTTKSPATPHKCKAIGGANAFFRAFGTSSFRAPRDEVVELEAGEYYLAAFEIETKKAIMRSCDSLARQNPKDASKCGGWDYEAHKPRFLSFSVGEIATTQTSEQKTNPSPIILPKVKIHLKAKEQASNLNNANNAKSTTQTKSSKKSDEDYEVVFIVEDFDKNINEQDLEQANDMQQDLAQNVAQDGTPQDEKSAQNYQNLAQNAQNHSYKAKSKRGNAIFSLGSSVRFEFADFANQKNDKNNQKKQALLNKSQDNAPANIDSSANPTQDTTKIDTQTNGI